MGTRIARGLVATAIAAAMTVGLPATAGAATATCTGSPTDCLVNAAMTMDCIKGGASWICQVVHDSGAVEYFEVPF